MFSSMMDSTCSTQSTYRLDLLPRSISWETRQSSKCSQRQSPFWPCATRSESSQMLQSHPTNSPSEEHRATWPKNSVDERPIIPRNGSVAVPHNNDGVSRYADAADFRSPPSLEGTGYVFTQHPKLERVNAKALAGDLQSVGPVGPDEEQENCSALMRSRYMWRGAVGVEGTKVLTGIGQPKPMGPGAGAGYDDGIEVAAVASGLEAAVASGLADEATSFGSDVPSSQPTRRSARAEIPKKKFFICCSPFLRCIFPRRERGVKFSFLPFDNAAKQTAPPR